MNADIVLHILTRFLHVGSVILLLGGVFYAKQALLPALEAIPEGQRTSVATASQQHFAGVLWTLLVLIVLSGLYNFFTYGGPKHSSTYHMWFGIKMLLVLHILATAILWATSPYRDTAAIAKSKRRLLGMVITGFLTVLISAYLRSLSQRGF